MRSCRRRGTREEIEMSAQQVENVAKLVPTTERRGGQRKLAARLEPFDSYWQAPADVDSGYARFAAYYRANYLPHLPADRNARILVVSCGPGYLVNLLRDAGSRAVQGTASDPAEIGPPPPRPLPCATGR